MKRLKPLFLLFFVCFSDFSSAKPKEREEAFYHLSQSKPKTIGAIAPSSEFLAKEMTRHIPPISAPQYILEVGAGTGVFTEQLVGNLGPEDTLDVIEIEPELCTILNTKFSSKPNVKILCLSILDWNPTYQYDHIVSGLPFNSFEVKDVQAILNHYEKLSKPDGTLSFFEYMFIPSIKSLFSDGATQNYIQNFVNQNKATRSIVLINLPPARVYKLSFQSQTASA